MGSVLLYGRVPIAEQRELEDRFTALDVQRLLVFPSEEELTGVSARLKRLASRDTTSDSYAANRLRKRLLRQPPDLVLATGRDAQRIAQRVLPERQILGFSTSESLVRHLERSFTVDLSPRARRLLDSRYTLEALPPDSTVAPSIWVGPDDRWQVASSLAAALNANSDMCANSWSVAANVACADFALGVGDLELAAAEWPTDMADWGVTLGKSLDGVSPPALRSISCSAWDQDDHDADLTQNQLRRDKQTWLPIVLPSGLFAAVEQSARLGKKQETFQVFLLGADDSRPLPAVLAAPGPWVIWDSRDVDPAICLQVVGMCDLVVDFRADPQLCPVVLAGLAGGAHLVSPVAEFAEDGPPGVHPLSDLPHLLTDGLSSRVRNDSGAKYIRDFHDGRYSVKVLLNYLESTT